MTILPTNRTSLTREQNRSDHRVLHIGPAFEHLNLDAEVNNSVKHIDDHNAMLLDIDSEATLIVADDLGHVDAHTASHNALAVIHNAALGDRLGLFVTQAELDEWEDRSVNGPFKTAGDVRSDTPGDWDDRTVPWKDYFVTNSLPYWKPEFTGVYKDGAGVSPPHHTTNNHVSRLRAAAFFALVKQDSGLADVVITWLHEQSQQPEVDYTDGSRWAFTSPTDSFRPSEYMAQLVQSYDYVRIMDGGSAVQRAAVEQWFADYLPRSRIAFTQAESTIWTDRWTFNVNTSNPFHGEFTHATGHDTTTQSRRYNNQRSTSIVYMALAGTLLDSSAEVGEAKQWVKEWLHLPFYGDHDFAEMYRTNTGGILSAAGSERGWHYTSLSVADVLLVADVTARNGDTELYDWSTRDGEFGSECDVGDPDKTLLEAARGYARYGNDVHERYGWDDSVSSDGIADHRIDGRRPRNGAEWRGNRELLLSMGNKYWQDTEVKNAYMRESAAGFLPMWPNPESAVTDWCGRIGFPGWLFCFGDMEHINPYPGP